MLASVDRVMQFTDTVGTGTYSIFGTADTFFTFAQATPDGTELFYCAAGGADLEVGVGVVGGSGTTLTRAEIISSTNAGALVDWPDATAKDLFVTFPAAALPSYGDVNPTATENVSFVGAQYINRATGEIFVCTDITTDANVWVSSKSAESASVVTVGLVVALS
jgi:hypothetical protein